MKISKHDLKNIKGGGLNISYINISFKALSLIYTWGTYLGSAISRMVNHNNC